jgi:hypothetical protein
LRFSEECSSSWNFLCFGGVAGVEGFSRCCSIFQLLERVPRSIGAILSSPARHSGVNVVLSGVVENVGRLSSPLSPREQKFKTALAHSRCRLERDAKARSAGGNIATDTSTPNFIATSNFATWPKIYHNRESRVASSWRLEKTRTSPLVRRRP